MKDNKDFMDLLKRLKESGYKIEEPERQLSESVEEKRKTLRAYHLWLLQNTDKTECLASIEEFLEQHTKPKDNKGE